MSTKKPSPRKRYSIIVSTGEKKLQANHVSLMTPELNKLVPTISEEMGKNFKSVEVKVVDCPDLTQWCGLAEKGLSGNARLADVGGVPYMMDPKYQRTSYQLPDVVRACAMEAKTPSLVIGAAAASATVVGMNAELMPNTRIPGPRFTRCARIDKPFVDDDSDDDSAKPEQKSSEVDKDVKVPLVGPYPSEETGCLANLFLSDGKPGPVLYIKAKVRTGELNFTNALREALKKVQGVGDKNQIGMGGVIKVNSGKVKAHIMPNFCSEKMDENNKEQIDAWLKWFEFGPNLLMLSCILTDDPTPNKSFHLRLEHTHFYSLEKNAKNANEGGHYHYDVTPDEIEYEAYFSLAEYIYRVEDAYYNIAHQ